MVTDSEASYLSRSVQEVEGLRDFLRFYQRVGPMQEQDVQVACLQPLQASVDPLDNVVKTQVEAAGQSFLRLVGQIDAALALEDEFISHVCVLFQEFTKKRLGFAEAINIRVIEKIDTALERGVDRSASRFYLFRVERRAIENAADHHAAVDQRAGGSFSLSHVRHLEHRTWEWLRRHALLFELRISGRTSFVRL